MKKIRWSECSEGEKATLLKRNLNEELNDDLKREVKDIIAGVKKGGDVALLHYTQKFDGIVLEDIKVSPLELQAAFEALSSETKEAITFAIQNIEAYQKAQAMESLSVTTRPGVICERQVRPIQRVGLYVPGGTAPLISTVMMLAIPARLAQCSVRILCTPPDKTGKINQALLATAWMCGVTEVYKVGGAQAIAAMAFGTETIPKVDKIFGPGNAWVTEAKLQVSQNPAGASIDLPAGPSEVMVIADESANPDYVAADLLSQAEHAIDAQVMLVTTSEKIAQLTLQAVVIQSATLLRASIIEKSLQQGAVIIVTNPEQAIEISNAYAPEHLILQVNEPEKWLANIQSAGAVFVGHFTPEAVGDYVTGSNHVLPTYGYAKNHSGLSILDFLKFIQVQYVSKEGIKNIGKQAEILADLEGLSAHGQAIRIRLNDLEVKSSGKSYQTDQA
jgi:histidinol dehydrogenase